MLCVCLIAKYFYLFCSLLHSVFFFFFFSSRRRHTRWTGDWSSDVCSSDLTCRYWSPGVCSRGRVAPPAPWSTRPATSTGRSDTTAATALPAARISRAATRVGSLPTRSRSEERRVGKEGRARGAAEH